MYSVYRWDEWSSEHDETVPARSFQHARIQGKITENLLDVNPLTHARSLCACVITRTQPPPPHNYVKVKLGRIMAEGILLSRVIKPNACAHGFVHLESLAFYFHVCSSRRRRDTGGRRRGRGPRGVIEGEGQSLSARSGVESAASRGAKHTRHIHNARRPPHTYH